jgi:excisionase family DNA binding protein
MLSTPQKEVINLKELATYTGLSKSTLWKKTMARTIPHFKVGKMLYFNVAEINKWLQTNRVETIEEIKKTIV